MGGEEREREEREKEIKVVEGRKEGRKEGRAGKEGSGDQATPILRPC